jgi:uncharacterized protein
MPYLVTAWDYQDSDALNRRMANRTAHLEQSGPYKTSGVLLYASALLDDDDQMIGSVLVLNLPTPEAVEAHLQQDPYVSGNVWERWTLQKVAMPPAATP